MGCQAGKSSSVLEPVAGDSRNVNRRSKTSTASADNASTVRAEPLPRLLGQERAKASSGQKSDEGTSQCHLTKAHQGSVCCKSPSQYPLNCRAPIELQSTASITNDRETLTSAIPERDSDDGSQWYLANPYWGSLCRESRLSMTSTASAQNDEKKLISASRLSLTSTTSTEKRRPEFNKTRESNETSECGIEWYKSNPYYGSFCTSHTETSWS